MGYESDGRVAGGAGALAALAAVGILFAGAGLVGDGVGPLDLWPDWTGSPRPSVEVAARSPNGPGVNPLLPLTPRPGGFRSLGNATAGLIVGPTAFSVGSTTFSVSPTTFSAGADVATAGTVFALAPLTKAPGSGASSAPGRRPGIFSLPNPAGDVPVPAIPATPAGRPAPATPAPATTTTLAAEPAGHPSRPGATPSGAREPAASVASRDQSSRPSSDPGSGSVPSSGRDADTGARPVASRDGATSSTPPHESVSGTTSSRPDSGRPPPAGESSPAPPSAPSSSASQPGRAAETAPAPPSQGMPSAGGGGSTPSSG